MNQAVMQEKADRLIALFDKAPIKHTFGMELGFNEKWEALFDMPHNPSLDHALGETHGGVISTLLDNAGWFTAAIQYDKWLATIDLHVEFLEHAKATHLRAVGELVRSGKRIATTRMELKQEDGKLIAIATGTFSVTSISYEG